MASKRLSAYNITAPCVIAPPSPLNFVNGLVGFIEEVAGSAGQLVANDCAMLGQASLANQIIAIPYQDPFVFPLGDDTGNSGVNLPIANGLVISQVPTGMVLTVVYTIYVPG